MYSGVASDYLLAVSVSTVGDWIVEARLTPADALHFAMTVEQTWRRAHLSQSIHAPVVEQSEDRLACSRCRV